MATRRKRPKLTVVIDTAEKRPWLFGGVRSKMATTIPRSLVKYGCDYTVLGYTGIIGVERKSWGDWINSIRGRHWSRFKTSLDKLRKHRFSLIVVEGRMSNYIIYSNIGTAFVAYRTAQIVTGGIPVIYADNPQIAETVCWEFFQHSIKRLNDERDNETETTEGS